MFELGCRLSSGAYSLALAFLICQLGFRICLGRICSGSGLICFYKL